MQLEKKASGWSPSLGVCPVHEYQMYYLRMMFLCWSDFIERVTRDRMFMLFVNREFEFWFLICAWRRFRSVSSQQRVFFDVKAERMQSVTERAKASLFVLGMRKYCATISVMVVRVCLRTWRMEPLYSFVTNGGVLTGYRAPWGCQMGDQAFGVPHWAHRSSI